MACPTNHKTVFVLDHGSAFIQPCEKVEFEFLKSRLGTAGYIPTAPIVKNMWTCTVEAVLEYCRIVWDIFPSGKLIRFVLCDTEVQTLNSWDAKEQVIT